MKQGIEQQYSFEEIVMDEWRALHEAAPQSIIQHVATVAHEHIEELLDKYRRYVNTDTTLKEFLHTDYIRQQWVDKFESWVKQLFDMQFTDGMHFLEVQNKVGEDLSRIGYPPHAVTKALRIIKSWVIFHIFHQQWSAEQKIQSVMYVTHLIGLSFEIRNYAYVKNISNQTRLDESYRLTAISNNIAMERERQRAFLSEWEKNLFFWLYRPSVVRLQKLSKSQFGLWLVHKASHMFERQQSMSDVMTCMREIDQHILPELEVKVTQGQAEISVLIDLVKQELDKIRFILGEIFNAHIEFENAKDVLTNLLDRRFMHTILSREINLQKRDESIGFGVLLIDLDYFKSINDEHGHVAGDMVLQKTAAAINELVRPSDFIFRYGGEEMLVVLIEIEPDKVNEIAEKMRSDIELKQFRLPNGKDVSITVSIGGVHAKGKYDYQAVINEADQALYQAKKQGRNKVFVAKDKV